MRPPSTCATMPHASKQSNEQAVLMGGLEGRPKPPGLGRAAGLSRRASGLRMSVDGKSRHRHDEVQVSAELVDLAEVARDEGGTLGVAQVEIGDGAFGVAEVAGAEAL